MPRRVKKSSFIIVIIIAVALIVLMAYTEAERERYSIIGNTLGWVVAPVQKGLYSISTYTQNVFYGIGERRNRVREYGKLKTRVAQLEKELMEMEELKEQNQRLKNLVNFQDENRDKLVIGAKVIGKNPGNWFNNLTIDKGTRHGVKINMAIVTNEGLVGRVVETADNWSKVRTIVDGKSAVSGIVQRNRDNGLIKGNNSLRFEDGTCSMIYLPEDSNIASGDKVLTSGLGEIIPKGIYIGKVEKVLKDKRELYKTAIIRPGVDFQRLEEVMVVTEYE